jgi:hypothetical protein
MYSPQQLTAWPEGAIAGLLTTAQRRKPAEPPTIYLRNQTTTQVGLYSRLPAWVKNPGFEIGGLRKTVTATEQSSRNHL